MLTTVAMPIEPRRSLLASRKPCLHWSTACTANRFANETRRDKVRRRAIPATPRGLCPDQQGRVGTRETARTDVACLITQRSQVQILPPATKKCRSEARSPDGGRASERLWQRGGSRIRPDLTSSGSEKRQWMVALDRCRWRPAPAPARPPRRTAARVAISGR